MAELKYPLSLVIRAVDRVSGPMQKINARLEKTTSRLSAPFRRLGDRLSVLSGAAGLPKIGAALTGVGTAAGALGTRVLGIGAAFAGMAAAGGLALYGVVRSAEAAGSRLEDLSALTGLSVNAFAELEFAAKRAGVENTAFASGMQAFNKSLSEARRGVGPLAGLLSKVGPVYLRQLKATKSNEEAFGLLAEAMGKIKDPGKRAELAAAAFGKAGIGMVNALKDGPASVEALRSEYRKLVGDQSAFAANSGALGDAFDNLELAMTGLRNTAAGALFPALTKLSEIVTKFIVKNRDGLQRWATAAGAAIEKWVDGGGMERLVSGLQSVARDVGAVVDKLGGLRNVAKIVGVGLGAWLAAPMVGLVASLGQAGWAIGLFVARMDGLIRLVPSVTSAILAFNFGPMIVGIKAAAGAFWAFNAALFANPITWVVAAVAALAAVVYVVYKNWEPISAFFKGVWDGLVAVASTSWTALKSFFSGLWDSITGIFTTAWAIIRPIIDGLVKFNPAALAISAGGWIGERVFGETPQPRPMLGAARVGPAGASAQPTEARVVVDFSNLPKGTRVTPERGNTAPLDLNLGYSMGGS